MKKAAFVTLLSAVLMLFVSCDSSILYTLTFNPGNGEPAIVLNSSSFILPEESPVSVGYDFTGWIDENGQPLDESMIGKTIHRNHSFTATYRLSESTAVITAANPESNSISAAIANKDIEVILLESGEYTEDLKIPANRTITIKGQMTAAQYASAGNMLQKTQTGSPEPSRPVRISGTITIGDNADATLDGILISSQDPSSSLIASSSSNLNLAIRDSVLIAPGKGRAIDIRMSDPVSGSGTTALTIEDTLIEITGNIGKREINGVYVDGDPSESKDRSELPSLQISVSNSRIIDTSSESSYIYPFGIRNFREIHVSISASEISTQNNHYAVWIEDAGNDAEQSTIDISESTLAGYSAFYAYSTINLRTTINNSTIAGHNFNDGKSSGFFTISLQEPKSTIVSVNGSTISFNKYGTSEQGIAELAWLIDESYKGSSIEFNNCITEFNNKPAEGSSRRLYCLENGIVNGEDTTGNTIRFDSLTLDSLLGNEYRLADGNIEGYANNIFSTEVVITAK